MSDSLLNLCHESLIIHGKGLLSHVLHRTEILLEHSLDCFWRDDLFYECLNNKPMGR